MTTRRPTYWPALDGVRAVAIVLVVVYHLGHLGGGWIGVDIFFVLSGFLITSLLLAEQRADGRVGLGRFWGRRAKRLLPAVLLLLVVLSVYAWAGGPGVQAAQLRSPELATLFYVANWQQIAFSHNYFAAFSFPSPLVHTWSLAIEEQYYLIWPLLVLATGALVVAWRSRRPRDGGLPSARTPWLLLSLSVVLFVASATEMGFIGHGGGVNRAYLGTDTRAWELLLGGIAAMVVLPRMGKASRRWSALSILGCLGAATVIVLASVGASVQPAGWLWSGGLVAAGLGTVVVIAGVVRAPTGVVARALALPPIRWLGVVSYSLYLWHWPVIVLVTPATIGLTGVPLLLVRLVLMMSATCFSFYLVEGPLRRANWRALGYRLLAPAGIAATLSVVLAATVTPPLAGTASLRLSTTQSSPTASSAAPPIVPASMTSPFVAPSASRPLRAWIIGDSVMEDSSLGVIAALQATGQVNVVANSSFGGWGLTRANWAQQASDVIAQYHPQMIIGTWSWDDQMASQDPSGYASLLKQAMSTWLAPGNGVQLVVLLQFPQAGPSPIYPDPSTQLKVWTTETGQQDAWDAIAKRTVLEFPGHALYLPTSQLFAPGGRYLTWFKTPGGTWVRARKVDEEHMCPYGSAEFGLLVLNDLGPVLHLGQPTPGWQFGSWTQDPRYNDPPGACPADQPPANYQGVPVPQVVTAATSAPSRD
jgi:peptidoglycan/LPS O-acetylase OafA/YrhL